MVEWYVNYGFFCEWVIGMVVNVSCESGLDECVVGDNGKVVGFYQWYFDCQVLYEKIFG